MDKRKQFQLQLLSNKLLEYNTKLANLKIRQCELLNNTPLDTPVDASTSESETILSQQKSFLEARMQQYRNDLTRYRNEYTSLNHQIKLLPSQMETNKMLEQDIYNEEIQHITGRIQEAQEDFLDKLNSLEIEKLLLVEQIQELQHQLAISQENISSIQEQAHASRKNTILELQQKKQQKLALATILDELNKNKELYTNNTADITNQLNKLMKLKTDIINAYYANPSQQSISKNDIFLEIPLAKELVPENILRGESAELLNIIVSYLDKQILDARYQLSSISKKTSRLEKSITTATTDIKSKLNHSHSTSHSISHSTSHSTSISTSTMEIGNRTRIISYKDNYKNAKLEKTTLEAEIKILLAKLNSWDIEIIDNARQEYKILLNSLEDEKHRAQERLDIMTARITSEYEASHITLATRIVQLENELQETNTLLQQTNLELSGVLEEITRHKSTTQELNDLTIQITNVELAIQKIQTDITSLGC